MILMDLLGQRIINILNTQPILVNLFLNLKDCNSIQSILTTKRSNNNDNNLYFRTTNKLLQQVLTRLRFVVFSLERLWTLDKVLSPPHWR